MTRVATKKRHLIILTLIVSKLSWADAQIIHESNLSLRIVPQALDLKELNERLAAEGFIEFESLLNQFEFYIDFQIPSAPIGFLYAYTVSSSANKSDDSYSYLSLLISSSGVQSYVEVFNRIRFSGGAKLSFITATASIFQYNSSGQALNSLSCSQLISEGRAVEPFGEVVYFIGKRKTVAFGVKASFMYFLNTESKWSRRFLNTVTDVPYFGNKDNWSFGLVITKRFHIPKRVGIE